MIGAPTCGVGEAEAVVLGRGTTTGNLWEGLCNCVGGISVGETVGLTGGNNLGITSFSSVAWGEGTSKGVEVRSPDKMRSRFIACGLRDNDHQIIPPIALKATKIPIKSSKPKGVLSDGEGSGGKEFVILTAKEYSQIKALTRAFAIPLLGRFFTALSISWQCYLGRVTPEFLLKKH